MPSEIQTFTVLKLTVLLSLPFPYSARFDEIDMWMYAEDVTQAGSFRRGFFVFLFLAIYLAPAIIIVVTCARISMALLKPWSVTQTVDGSLDNRVTRRQEENKRKVSEDTRCWFHIQISVINCY